MVRLSPIGLIYVIVFLALLFLFNGRERSWNVNAKIAVEGAAPGLVVVLYVNNAMTPWTLTALIVWTIVLICGSVIATAVAWWAAARISSGTGRGIVGVSIGLVVGAATVSTAALAIREARPDLLPDPTFSIFAIGASAGVLAGAFLEFNRRRAWSAI